jgi:putative transposase
VASQKEKRALQRYQAVSNVMLRVARGDSLRKACAHVASIEFYDVDLKKSIRFSASSLRRWVKAFESRGIGALQVQGRNRPPQALSPQLLDAIRSEKMKDGDASVPEVIRRVTARMESGCETSISRSTVWRAVARMGLPTGPRSVAKEAGTARSFEFAHRMQCVLCDGKHFTVGPTHLKRVVFIWLDDASRRVLDLAVGTAESTELFVMVLSRAVRRAGLADRVFLDRGPGFRADDSAVICARLKMHLILGTAGYPEARGKIERFNQTLKRDVLRNWVGSADVPTDTTSLELRLRHYCFEVYNKRPHSSLEGMSPDERWRRDALPLRPVTEDELRAACLISRSRKVSPHHLVEVSGEHLEMPIGTAGSRVVLEHDLLSGCVYFNHGDQRIRLQKPDRRANAHEKRSGRRAPSQDQQNSHLPPSAADLQFLRDYMPITDASGGFQDDE